MALQSDGRILLVGAKTLLRFNTDGSLDTTFGTGGQVHVPFDQSSRDTAQDVAVQADGRIVVVGFVSSDTQVGKDDFAVARFNANGTVDTSFGTAGLTTTDFFGISDEARRVKIQPDGKILVIGLSVAGSIITGSEGFALARYNTDGTLDTGFGGGGKARDLVGPALEEARGLAIQSDGKIVLVGTAAENGGDAPHHVGLIRYLGDGNVHLPGTRDETFGPPLNQGTVDTDLGLVNADGEDVLIGADGTIFVAGSLAPPGGHLQFFLAQFDAQGVLKGGAARTSFTDQSDAAASMLMQADGKIVVVGTSADSVVNSDWAVVRYNSGGLAVDTTFGTDGKIAFDFLGGRDAAYAVVQQPDGKLVIGGFANNGLGPVFALARLAP
jgi:uncharacterized delta-60 repeat protein